MQIIMKMLRNLLMCCDKHTHIIAMIETIFTYRQNVSILMCIMCAAHFI